MTGVVGCAEQTLEERQKTSRWHCFAVKVTYTVQKHAILTFINNYCDKLQLD